MNNVPSDPSDILAVFKTFFPDSMVDKFVEFTNKYANILQNDPIIKAQVAEKQKSYFKNWVDVTHDKFWVYIAVILLMGIIQKPNFDLYWTNDAFFDTQIFKRLISRTCYRQLRTIIHFSDPPDFDADDSLKLLWYIIDELSHLYISNYTPKENIAVDEYFRIYIPSKRGRYGVKLFMLCESEASYLSSFIIYTGSSTDYGHIDDNILLKPWALYKSPSKVVLYLLKSFFNQGYILMLDNCYTSAELANALLNLQTDCLGTL